MTYTGDGALSARSLSGERMNPPLHTAAPMPSTAADGGSGWRRLSSAWLPALVVLLLGTSVTATLWRDALERSGVAADARFEYRTERIRNELDHRLDGYEATLRSLAGLIASRSTFERAAWRRYFEQAQPIDHYPGRLFLAYAVRVPAADVAAHEKAVQSDGIADYRVRSRDPNATGDRYPLGYMRAIGDKAAVAKTQAQLGSDLADDPVAVGAMTRAAREARTILAGPLVWSRSQAEEDQVWALFVPVFQGGPVPEQPEARQAALTGYVVETFNPMETAGGSLGPDAKLIGMKVLDGELPLFTCPEMKRELAQGFRPTLQRTSTIEFGTRVWRLQFTALPGYLAATETDQPYLVLVAGALVSLLLAGLVGTLAGQRAGALRLVRERTAALRTALAKSEASETQMRAVVDHALDSIITIDERGTVHTFNPAAERTFGYVASEVIGRNVNMLMPEPDRQGHDGYLHNFLTTGDARIIGIGREVTGRRKDGSTFPMELGVSDMRIGEQRFFCGIVRDITQRRQAEGALLQERALLETRVNERTEVLSRTNSALHQEIHERKRVERALTDAREQALQAADAKANFLANMSHEIRTPMNAVIGMTALLEETALNAEQRSYLETLRVGGDALLAVINDILDFSKVESGKLELERRPFELGACVEEAFDMLAPRAGEKNIDLLYTLDDAVPRWIVGDATRLRQVLTNLLSNAVKFTERGEVCVSVSVLGRQGAHVRQQFAVRDSGIGIAADKVEHLFKAFSQADSSTTRKYGGTGLGLAICQRLTQMMGGEVAVESVEGRGATFRFSISAEVVEPPPGPARYVTEPRPELVGRRMLLVDDNPTTLRILQSQCQRWGLRVEAVAGAADALALLERDREFDVAVLDLHMAGMDGVQLAQQIRWLCPGTTPALMLLSSSLQRRSGTDRTELFAARLAKPVKHTQLLAALSQVLQPVPEGGRAPEAARRLDSTLGQRLPLRILVAEDSAINQKLAVGILAKLGYASDVAANGAEALELVRLNRYDLVFMDLQMPEVDGLEATRRIVAEWPAHQRPRLVAMTANALAGDRERCIEAGMDDYIAKPILPVDVQTLIERLCGNRHAFAQDAVDPLPLIDARVIDELRQLDEPNTHSLLHGLLPDYLHEAPAAISDIKRLADRREARQLAHQAHKLGGVSASLGACGMADMCRRIEQQLANGDLASLPAMIDQLEMRFARTRAEIQRFV
jgi:PAS domain S-box-containing protein